MSVIVTRVIGISVTVEAHSVVACNQALDTLEDRLFDKTPKRWVMVEGIKLAKVLRRAIVEDNRA